MMEESLRMPLLMRYPRMIEPGSACDAMVLNVDFAATFLDLAGITVPADMQGQSLRPLLAGNQPAAWRRSMYYRYYANEYAIPPQYGIRTERWKLVHYQGSVGENDGTPVGTRERSRPVDEWELFDLKSKASEAVNLYQEPEIEDVLSRLKGELAKLQRELADQTE